MSPILRRLLFFGCYIVFALVLAGFLASALGGDEGVWALFGLGYAATTFVALIFATALPLSYCTILKAVGLAVSGSLLVFVLGYAVEFLRGSHA